MGSRTKTLVIIKASTLWLQSALNKTFTRQAVPRSYSVVHSLLVVVLGEEVYSDTQKMLISKYKNSSLEFTGAATLWLQSALNKTFTRQAVPRSYSVVHSLLVVVLGEEVYSDTQKMLISKYKNSSLEFTGAEPCENSTPEPYSPA